MHEYFTVSAVRGSLALFALGACLLAVMLSPVVAAAPVTLVFDTPQTAVLDPVQWDTVLPHELYFDAVRPLLVRFPGMADQVYPLLKQGYRVERAELVLTWEKQEGAHPERGRGGWGADELYANNPGAWHVQAWALKRPWSVSDPALGPTFNASINGGGYWTRGGARGTDLDRAAHLFGPLPLHANSPQARLDVTPAFNEASFGMSPATRLRTVEECGFQLQKMELADMKYRSFYAYDWSVGIGYMKIWVDQPRLVVTLTPEAKAEKPGMLPPATDIVALAKRGPVGIPPMGVPANWKELIAQHLTKPAGVPDWQWARIEELRAIGPEPNDSELYLGRGMNFAPLWAGDEAAYLKAMKNLLKMAPRTWQGHPTTDFAILAAGYHDLLPPAVQDHLKLYWTAWLHPEVEISTEKYLGGGVQRGGPTYFRGYTHSIGTCNFNHNAITGSLLGGQYLQAPSVRKDASYGLENILMRTHVLADGVHQEIGDTYYQAITVAGAGAIAKFAEDPTDKLMGRVLRDRLLEPLMSMYHPGLRRMTHPMSRGDYTYQLLLQEGPYSVLHSLSPQGVLLHLDKLATQRRGTPSTWGKIHGVSILGDEAPPQRIAVLAPWVEPYLADSWAKIVDEKPLPWSIMAYDEIAPGERFNGWHINYLGRNYALACRDNTNYDYGTIPIAAQWRRKAARVQGMDDYSTLQINFGINNAFTPPYMPMGEFGVLQQHNTLLALKGLPERRVIEEMKTPVTALHTSVAFFATGDTGAREVWINNRKIDTLSGARPDPGDDWKKKMFSRGAVVQAKDRDIITINDGATYLGLIPLTVNPLERDKEVEIAFEYPLLLIHTYLRSGKTPVNLDQLYAADKTPTAGYLLHMADAEEFANFDAFRAYMAGIAITQSWNTGQRRVELACTVGNDTLELGYNPTHYPADYRRVNGHWPYLATGIMRDTPWSVQAITPRLEKAGAVLESEPGRTSYLLAVPQTGTYVGYNALPDPTAWRFTVPGGLQLISAGRVSILRATVNTQSNAIWIDYAEKADQQTPDMATALLVAGAKTAPVVTLNDHPLGKLTTATVNGQTVYLIPLRKTVAPDLAARVTKYQALAGVGEPAYIRAWKVVGPFPLEMATPFPPEKGVKLTDTYAGVDKKPVKWTVVQKPGEPALSPDPVNLEALMTPGKNVCAYAYTVIHADREQEATLFSGSDQEMIIWLNGTPVFKHVDYYRSFSRDMDRTAIHLKQGDNPLLIKFGHNWEAWRFSVRLADPDGLPLTGISYATP